MDTARFRVDDPDELVAASFACPCCLLEQTDAVIAGDDHEQSGTCSCRICGTQWTVALTDWQVARLRLRPLAHRVEGFGLRLRARGRSSPD